MSNYDIENGAVTSNYTIHIFIQTYNIDKQLNCLITKGLITLTTEKNTKNKPLNN